ncbi:glycine/D-amino acid oxidase-like deaminating enzyme [Aliiruegeria haliotis]|uniref:Glycine/D-amino acid oxidase-like deaminating enzyme n=1 Tax=Aliiruegeria haliotis TaxID=1280846 RepID=A0A2T0RN40_9RHOB|nr:FAD-binding oxidoreductase [Aliiruegeria haliotis]PRY22561.1 glycine/D-amino acid oxidase-like deaminating enzyme [Aliiruegeria haliotis]
MTRYTARRLPKQPGSAGWNRLLPPPPPARILDGDATADIAIIGAGFAGLSAARRLIQIDPGLKVAVLEAGRVGDGPAGRNSGFMIDLPHDLASESYAGTEDRDAEQTRLTRAAIAFAAAAADDYGLGRDAFDPCGKINAAATPAGDGHNRDYAAHLAKMGEDHRLLDAAEMAALTGTEYYSSGLFTPGTVMLQPAAYIRGLAAGLTPAIALHEDSPVTGILRDGEGWRLETSRASLRAQKVILANNGHAESFGFFARRLLHFFTYASMTEPLPDGALGGARRWGATPADPMGTTVRRIDGEGGGRIVIRSRFTCDPSMEVSNSAIAAAGRLHDRKFIERFPMLAETGIQYRWAGHLCLSWNGVPAHGEVATGVFSAICQNGLGTSKGTLAGMSAAEMALGEVSEITRAFAAMEAPKRLPPEPLATIGANATLRWKEWRAGRE